MVCVCTFVSSRLATKANNRLLEGCGLLESRPANWGAFDHDAPHIHICMFVGHVHKMYSIISICKNDVYSTQLLIMDFVCYRRDCYSVCM